jgi:hypothetical protein
MIGSSVEWMMDGMRSPAGKPATENGATIGAWGMNGFSSLTLPEKEFKESRF